MKRIAVFALACVGFLGSGTASAADVYPSKLVRIVVPFAAGGPTDLLGRAMAQRMNDAWKQPVIVENRPAGGGVPGADYVAKQRGDGYVLLLGSATTHAVAPSLYAKLPYDVERDFVPITELAFIPQLLSVHPSLPVRSVKELVALARARPGEINYAAGGVGAAPHMSMELFQQTAKVKMTHVQYRGAGPAMIGLLSGEASAMFDSLITSVPHMKSGKVRTLAVTSLQRSPIVPQAPTISESGYPGFEALIWYGLFAPAGTPPEVVKAVYETVAASLKSPEMHELLSKRGVQPVASAPPEFAKRISSEIAKWRTVIRNAGLKAEF